MTDDDVEIAAAWLRLEIGVSELRAAHDGDELAMLETLTERHHESREARHKDVGSDHEGRAAL